MVRSAGATGVTDGRAWSAVEDAGDALHGRASLRGLQPFLRRGIAGVEFERILEVLRSAAEVAVFHAAITAGGECLRAYAVVGSCGGCARGRFCGAGGAASMTTRGLV